MRLIGWIRQRLDRLSELQLNIYAANASNVCMNMARGTIIYENGNFLTLDLDEILREVEHYAVPKLFS